MNDFSDEEIDQNTTTSVSAKMLKKLEEYIAGHVGNWAYFVGRCIADGFRDQMEELDEQEVLAGMQAEDDEDEILKVSGGKKVPEGHEVN